MRIFLLLLGCLSAPLYACDASIEQLLQKHYGNLEQLVCEQSPLQADEVVAVFLNNPLSQMSRTTYDAHLVFIKDKVITHHLVEAFQAHASTDAEIIPAKVRQLSHIAIDVKPYALSKDQKALGVGYFFVNKSKTDPYHGSYLNLYLKEGNALRRVLKGLQMAWHIDSFESCTRMLVDFQGDLETTNKLPLFSDLIFNVEHKVARVSCTNVCKREERLGRSSFNLKFKDGEYAIPIAYLSLESMVSEVSKP